MLKSVRSVFLFVRDIRGSRDWYAGVLGYGPSYEDERFALFDVGPVQLCFHLADAKSPVTTGGSVAYWWVEDFDAAVTRFEGAGGEVYRGPLEVEGRFRICQIRDPFGNVIGLEGAV